jgi:hypothetical protein
MQVPGRSIYENSDRLHYQRQIEKIKINIIQLLHLNEINMRFYGAEYNNIERGSIKPHIEQVQV